jgi:hypothetical protein
MSEIENNTPELTARERFEVFTRENKLELTYQFIPFSLSRNCEEKESSLNWKIKIKNDKGSFTTDFMKGTGHLGYSQLSPTNSYQKNMIAQAIETAVETGTASNIVLNGVNAKVGMTKKDFPHPTLEDILYSLTLDATAKNFSTFESWASDLGFDTDSRSAEKTYLDCQKTAQALIKILGNEEKLDELTQLMLDVDDEPAPSKFKIKM